MELTSLFTDVVRKKASTNKFIGGLELLPGNLISAYHTHTIKNNQNGGKTWKYWKKWLHRGLFPLW